MWWNVFHGKRVHQNIVDVVEMGTLTKLVAFWLLLSLEEAL